MPEIDRDAAEILAFFSCLQTQWQRNGFNGVRECIPLERVAIEAAGRNVAIDEYFLDVFHFFEGVIHQQDIEDLPKNG